MATVYGLFFVFLFNVICCFSSVNNSFLVSLFHTTGSFFTSSCCVPTLLRELERSGTEGSTSFIGKVTSNALRPGVMRDKIINIAAKELGVREATGNNDGPRVEEYLAYTGLGKGYAWCAAFVSWSYAAAGSDVPRNPWSPALFPKARLLDKAKAQSADVFGIYGTSAKRIDHVGLVSKMAGAYLVSIEGNSNNRVESRRRHLRTVHAIAKWVN